MHATNEMRRFYLQIYETYEETKPPTLISASRPTIITGLQTSDARRHARVPRSGSFGRLYICRAMSRDFEVFSVKHLSPIIFSDLYSYGHNG